MLALGLLPPLREETLWKDLTQTTCSGLSTDIDLAGAMRRAAVAHGEHEKRSGQRDANWPDWYAAYMAAEQAGTELPK